MDDELTIGADDVAELPPDQAGGSGSAFGATVQTVDNVPGDPEADLARAKAEADHAVESAQRAVAKAKAHLAGAPKEKKARQREHLAGAELALKEARKARERIK